MRPKLLYSAIRGTRRGLSARGSKRGVQDLASGHGRGPTGEAMSKGDLLVERGARGREELSRKAAEKGGFAGKISGELAEDAVFLRKLKPSLIKARASGTAPVNQAPEPEPKPPRPPKAAQPRRRRKARRPRRTGGPNPFVVLGIAVVAGIALAKVVDWRGHAHPRD